VNTLHTRIRLILSSSAGNREMGRELGMSYNTVRRYREIIQAQGLDLAKLAALDEKQVRQIFKRQGKRGQFKRVPDWPHIHRELQRKGVTRTLLWVEYKEEDPASAYELSRFNELYAEWAGKLPLSMRQQYEPGERGWADFSGTTMSWVDPSTGEYHKAEIFIGSAGVGGLLFALAVPSQKQAHWIHAHCQWYEALGGVPLITVPDNLKSAVQKAGLEPVLNPAYLDMAEHYGTIILPARVRRPKDKSLAEGGVLLFLRWGIARLRNRLFHSIGELNAAIKECVQIINARVMRHYQQSRRERFESIDRPALLPLPTPYEYGDWVGPIRVPLDYHIAVMGHFYSVPYRLVHQSVTARCTVTTVEIMNGRSRVASHVRSEAQGGKTTDRAHMPEHHLAWADHTPERYKDWARRVGPDALSVVERLLADVRHPAAALNACGALQKLARKYPVDRFELACGKALSIHSPTVKSIRSLLQHQLEGKAAPTSMFDHMPTHTNVRGSSYYQTQELNHAA
jgi:transposase